MPQQATASAVQPFTIQVADYEAVLQNIRDRFAASINGGKVPLFTTDADGLFAAFLTALPDSDRQHYTCHACRHFVDRFGGLVTIREDGSTTSAVWDSESAPEAFEGPIRAMERLVRRAKVTGVFLSSLPVWGQPVTGDWHHFAVTPTRSILFERATMNAGQAMAEKHEDYGQVQRALAEFPIELVTQAVTILKAEALYRSEKFLGVAEWLERLHRARAGVRGPARDNLTWLAVATAPAGFCHPRSSMIGTLLEDIAAGMPFETVKRRFTEKVHPLQYQRPQAAPTAGAIAQAEKVVAQLGAAGALRRRFARIDEVQALWRPAEPKPAETPAEGVFSHLTPKGAQPKGSGIVLPPTTMTWDKFRRTVLPEAETIEFYVPGHDNYCALVTAAEPEAPPILQWDSLERRNPVSWYVYHGGSPANRWGLTSGAYYKVTAVTLQPSAWFDETAFSHQGGGVLFVLDGAKDSVWERAGAGIFPETLRSEFHGIRSTIEAYSRNASIEGYDQSSACGVVLDKGGKWSARFRVTSNGTRLEYVLDRFD